MNAHLQRLALLGAGVLVIMIGALLAVSLDRDEEQPAAESANVEQEIVEREASLIDDERELLERNEASRQNQAAVGVGDRAPDFQLRGESGQVALADYRGRPLVIEFAQSSCPHCQNMASVFDAVMGAHPDVAYLIVGVAEPAAATRSWYESFLGKPMRGDLAFDPKLKAAKRYGVAGTPTTVFIKPDGTIMEILAGEMSRDELSRKVAQLAEA